MATIYNSDLSKELTEGAKVQVSRDRIPSELAEKVVPTMEVNPKLLRRVDLIRHTSSSSTGTITVHTTHATKETFISFLSCGFIKDVACDISTGRMTVNITVGGVAREVVGFPVITLTAQEQSVRLSFPVPIRVDKNTSITFTGAFTAGVMSRTLCIGGWEVESGA